MSPNTSSRPAPPPLPSVPPPPAKKIRWLLYVCGSLLALLLLVVATVFITIWWIQRPIKPVVLSAPEKAVVEEKLRHFGGGNAPASPPTITPVPNRRAVDVELPYVVVPPLNPDQKPDRPYVPGSKLFKLTEREINGLLNANTDLGKSVRLEFAQDAVNAYVAVPIPEDFPIGGGKMFRARGRFRISLGNGGTPYAILEDITVFGLSLPKTWLGGLKGENLLGDAMGQGKRGPVLRGIKSLRIEPGALVLEVED
jgi:hypothetical protein